MHILSVLNAMGRVKIRNRPEMIRHDKPRATPLQAPTEVLDPRTLEHDGARPALPYERFDYSATPPSNRVKLVITDGRVEYEGPEGETTRLLARHGRQLAAGARLMAPEEAFDARVVAMMIPGGGP